MANPNIATMSDMTLGKLKWTVSSNQPLLGVDPATNNNPVLTQWSVSNQSYNHKQLSMTVADVSSFSAQSDSMLVITSANNRFGIRTPDTNSSEQPSATYPRWVPNSTGTPEPFTYHPSELQSHQSNFGDNFDIYYLMNPTAGAGTLYIEYYGYHGGYGWYTYCYGGCVQIANTNGQANPFRAQPLTSVWTGHTEMYHLDDATNYSGYYRDQYTPPTSQYTSVANSFWGAQTNPGDFVFSSSYGGSNSGSRTNMTHPDGGEMKVLFNGMYSWNSNNYFAYRAALGSRTDMRTNSNNVQSSGSNWRNHYGFVLKGADPKPLFTVTPPTASGINQIVKINQIVAINPETDGMQAELSLSGLPTSFTDSSGDELFTIPADMPLSSTVPFKKGIVATTNGTDCIDRPFYMPAGSSLNCIVSAPGADSADDWKSLDLVIDFEVIQS